MRSKGKKELRYYKDINPGLFAHKYTRKCSVKPDILPKTTDMTTLKSALIFPKTPEEGEQFVYTCDGKGEKKYVGLQKNEPGMDYEYVPCCYVDDQMIKKKSKYTKYYNPEQFIAKKTPQNKPIDTNKILSYRSVGYLEAFPKIKQLFYSDSYFRYGMNTGRLSFLECLMRALLDDDSDSIRMKDVHKTLKKITSDLNLLSVATQQLPDKPVEQIAEDMLNDNLYFDPKIYIRILEVYFNFRIFIFSKDGLVVPTHSKNFLYYQEKRPTAIILEHTGSESDKVLFPQCELIIRIDKGKSLFQFPRTDQIVKDINLIFHKMTSSYILNTSVTPYTLEKEIKSNLSGQKINSFGKCQALILNEKNIVLYPAILLPPLPIPIENDEEHILNIQTVMDILESLFPRDQNTYTKINNGDKTIGISVTTYLNNTYIIRVIPKKDSDVPLLNILLPNTKTESYLDAYNSHKKTALFLSGYILYLFSLYVYENKLEISEKSIKSFVKRKTLVDPSIQYGNISKKFGINNRGCIRDNKLVLQNDEVLKRLVYLLRLEISKNLKSVISYHTRKFIETPITSVSDFEQYSTQVVVEGIKSFDTYVDERTNVPVADVRVVDAKKIDPYFSKFMDTMYIAYNTDTLEDAENIQHTWEKEKYLNTRVDNYTHARTPVGLYLFENTTKFELVSGTENDPKVLGYSYNDENKHTALLDLSILQK